MRARRARLSTGKGYLYVLVVGVRGRSYLVREANGRWGTHPLYRPCGDKLPRGTTMLAPMWATKIGGRPPVPWAIARKRILRGA